MSDLLTLTPPPLPPGYDKHHLVVLEECHCPLPAFSFPHTYAGYLNTLPSQVSDRIKDATILITTIVPVTPQNLDAAPHLQCMAIMATGMGWIDRAAFATRGIVVVNFPQSNIPAVSEHWLGLYFASRKRVVQMHNLTTTTREWAEKGTLTGYWAPRGPPLSAAGETLGIVGYGALGRRIEGLAKGVGFGRVIVAERKGEEAREGRVTFEEMLKVATSIVLCCPKDKDTVDLIGEKELKGMRKECCLVNMARGGIVNEEALAKALREGWIQCAATDVLDVEPGEAGTSPLLPDVGKGEEAVPNLTISPHVSWYSVKTVEMLHKLLLEGVGGFVEGGIVRGNVVVLGGEIYK